MLRPVSHLTCYYTHCSATAVPPLPCGWGNLVCCRQRKAIASFVTCISSSRARALCCYFPPLPGHQVPGRQQPHRHYPCFHLHPHLPAHPVSRSLILTFSLFSELLLLRHMHFLALVEEFFSLHSNQLEGPFPTSLFSITSLESLYLSSNSFYGPIPDCLFNAFPCLNRLDVSHNSFYGRINRNFEGIVPTAGGLLNLAHNYFYGDPVLFASGCQFCPSEIAGESTVEPGDLSVQAGGNCVVQSEAGRWVGVS
ncbi:unnamed protein product [Closterium sp. Yama58-4]|nr:unnamed protein product [Closterium sp. Yama58-4]